MTEKVLPTPCPSCGGTMYVEDEINQDEAAWTGAERPNWNPHSDTQRARCGKCGNIAEPQADDTEPRDYRHAAAFRADVQFHTP